MKTENLILELAGAAKPVRPNFSPALRSLLWLGISTAWVLAGTLLIGVRSDLGTSIAGQALLLLAATGLSVFAGFRISVPGEKLASRAMFFAAFPLLLWGGWMAVEAAHFPSEPGTGIKCLRNILFLGSLPALLFFYLLKRGLPLRAGWLGWLAAGGAVALANAGTCFICHNEGAGHVLVWHFFPVTVLGLAGIPFGRWIFRLGLAFPPLPSGREK